MVADIWKTWLEILYQHLQVFQRSTIPTVAKNQKCLPKQFAGYNNTRMIIDATEVKIEKPTDLKLQAATWSNYKRKYSTLTFFRSLQEGVSCPLIFAYDLILFVLVEVTCMDFVTFADIGL